MNNLCDNLRFYNFESVAGVGLQGWVFMEN